MMMKAAIDIGTNSTRLLIAKQMSHQKLIPIHAREQITRLGEGLARNRCLSQAAIERVVETILDYNETIEKFNVQEVSVVATSAVRDAQNKAEFLRSLKQCTNRNCRIISGDEEAHLTFIGVCSDFPQGLDLIIIDVGGGSTEYIIVKNGQLHTKVSMDIGSRRLTERFFHHDPVTDEEFSAFRGFIRQHITSNLSEIPEGKYLGIGVGGTASTLAQIHTSLSNFDPQKIHLTEIDRDRLNHLASEFRSKTIRQRCQIIGLNPKRADVILAGSAILVESLELLQLRRMIVSLRDILFGVLLANSSKSWE